MGVVTLSGFHEEFEQNYTKQQSAEVISHKSKLGNCLYLFPTQVWIFKTDKVDNKKLERIILNAEERNPTEGPLKNTYSGIQSQYDLLEDKEFYPLWKFVSDCMCEIVDNNKYKQNVDVGIGKAWANINRKNNFNRAHIHPHSFWSSVYYIKTPKHSGDIYLEDPRHARVMYNEVHLLEDFSNPAQHFDYKINVEEGKLIIFPGWLSHFVAPNNSDGERISISMNIDVKLVDKETGEIIPEDGRYTTL